MGLEERCAAQRAADAVVELMLEQVAGDPQYYWEVIKKAIPATPATKGKLASVMTDDEVSQFEKRIVPYGKYLGYQVAYTPIEWLDWLAGDGDAFKDEVRRYLRNPTVAAKVQAELGLGADDAD